VLEVSPPIVTLVAVPTISSVVGPTVIEAYCCAVELQLITTDDEVMLDEVTPLTANTGAGAGAGVGVGAGAGAAGDTELLDADSSDVATPFPNFTLNVYAVPFDKPLTVIGEVEDVPVRSDGVEVAV
jgi:hypothetical protein